MYVCTVCMHVCTYVCMYVCMYVFYLYADMLVCIRFFVRLHVCIYLSMYVCMYVCMYVQSDHGLHHRHDVFWAAKHQHISHGDAALPTWTASNIRDQDKNYSFIHSFHVCMYVCMHVSKMRDLREVGVEVDFSCIDNHHHDTCSHMQAPEKKPYTNTHIHKLNIKYIHTYIHTYTHIYSHIHICIHIYIQVHLHS